MKPLKDRILIQADEPRVATESGILIHEEWKTLPHTGVVIAVGPEVVEIKVGDRVLFERYASVILENGKRMCQESHVLAVLEGENG